MITGLLIVLVMVLVLPFVFHRIEENLEPFLFVMGIAAALISHKMDIHLITEALKEPVMIATAVLVAGALFFLMKEKFAALMGKICKQYPIALVVFAVVLILGLISSVITAIVASIILVEIIYQLPISRKDKVIVCILACYSIGLGAALTPIGEPLATIAISKLDQEFFFLFQLLGRYIIPAALTFAIIAAVYTSRVKNPMKETDGEMAATSEVQEQHLIEDEEVEEDTWKGVIIRALKVYLFVMALVFLGEGFEPLIEKYILGLNPQILYWVNMISAVLDNATLCAAEVSPAMMSDPLIVKAILMGLLISGGMLIPGNIPNIIAASKLRIGSKEWAIYGVPIGLVYMGIFFLLIFGLGL